MGTETKTENVLKLKRNGNVKTNNGNEMKLKNLKLNEIVLKTHGQWHFLCAGMLAVSQTIILCCPWLLRIWCQRVHHKLKQNVFSVSVVTSLQGRGTEPASRLTVECFWKPVWRLNLCSYVVLKKLKLKNISKWKKSLVNTGSVALKSSYIAQGWRRYVKTEQQQISVSTQKQ